MSEEEQTIYAIYGSFMGQPKDIGLKEAKLTLRDYTAQAVKKAEVAARIDERRQLGLDTYDGKTFSPSTDWLNKYNIFIKNNRDRIAALKTEQVGLEKEDV